MSASSHFLSYGGRLQLVNSVISSLPTYYLCSLKLPVTVVEVIDKYKKNCLWRGNNFKNKGYNLAAWDLVRTQKSKGGPGVINISLQNDALLLKHLDKFYRKADIQWVKIIWEKYYSDSVPHLSRERGSFWWKDILRLNVQFRGIALCLPNKGDTISFWDDLIDGRILSSCYAHLFQYAKDPNVSLWNVRSMDNLLELFRIPMSKPAYNEFLELQAYISQLEPYQQDINDQWTYIWGNQKYSSNRYYQHHFAQLQPQQAILWLWKSKCVPKIKFFAWLLLNDRINTRNILRRRGKYLEEAYSCVLCQYDIEETVDHLFFDCPSALSQWSALGISWDEELNIFDKIYKAKDSFQRPFFMEVFLIGIWCIWNERNNLIFNNEIPMLSSWKSRYKGGQRPPDQNQAFFTSVHHRLAQ